MRKLNFILLLVILLSSEVLFANKNNISKVAVKESKGKVEVLVFGTQKPTFTVFKLRNPLRLIVDISNATINGIESPININNGVIKQIITSQFEDDVNTTTRIMLSLFNDAKYSVKSVGNKFLLTLKDNSFKGEQMIVRKSKNEVGLEKKDRYEKIEKKLQFKQKELVNTKQQLNDIKDQLLAKKKELEDRKKELEIRKKQLESRKKQLEDRKKVISIKEKGIADRENLLSQKEKELKALNLKLNSLARVIGKKDSLLKDRTLTIKKLKKELTNNKLKVQSIKNEISLLKQKKVSKKENKKIVAEKIKKLKNKNLSLINKQNKLLTSLSGLENEKKDIVKDRDVVLSKYNKQKRSYQILAKKHQTLIATNKKLIEENINYKKQLKNSKVVFKEKKLSNKNIKKLKKQISLLTEKLSIVRNKYEDQLTSLQKANRNLIEENKSLVKQQSKMTAVKEAILKDLKVLKYKDRIVVNMNIDNYTGDFEILELLNPNRLVVELPKTKLNKRLKKEIAINQSIIKSIRLGENNIKSKVVFDIVKYQNIPKYFLKKENNQLKFTMVIKKEYKPNNLVDVDFNDKNKFSVVKLKFDNQVKYSLVRQDNDLAVVKFYNVKTPDILQNTIDSKAKNSLVKMVSIFQSSNDTILAVKLQNKAKNGIQFDKKSHTFTWKFKNNIITAKRSKKFKTSNINSGDIKYYSSEAASYQSEVGIDISKKKYYGKRISIDFKNADIHDVLELIADVSKVNIITSDDVTGTITMKLRNVQWDKALDVILKTKNLGKEILGNIIRVAPQETLTKEYQSKMDFLKKQADNIPLGIRLIPVNYAHADELVEQVKGLLTKRGNVSVDARTNVLIVKDVYKKLDEAEALIRNLDTPTPQVLIEGRIVEASSSFSSQQGIQWGTNIGIGQSYGTPTGLNFPSSITMTGSETSSGWITNLPASTADGGGGVQFSLGSIDNSLGLNLKITAAEAEGQLKIISSPRISTLDNKEAVIETGLKLPIITINEQGTPTTKLIDAKITLTVKPHVTSDGSIILKMDLKKEEPDFSRVNSLGDPAIISKTAKTELLIKDGQTAVIGGMYTKKISSDEKRVPFLGSIPILGWFFKLSSETDERSELLIFITPRIINRATGLTSK